MKDCVSLCGNLSRVGTARRPGRGPAGAARLRAGGAAEEKSTYFKRCLYLAFVDVVVFLGAFEDFPTPVCERRARLGVQPSADGARVTQERQVTPCLKTRDIPAV